MKLVETTDPPRLVPVPVVLVVELVVVVPLVVVPVPVFSPVPAPVPLEAPPTPPAVVPVLVVPLPVFVTLFVPAPGRFDPDVTADVEPAPVPDRVTELLALRLGNSAEPFWRAVASAWVTWAMAAATEKLPTSVSSMKLVSSGERKRDPPVHRMILQAALGCGVTVRAGNVDLRVGYDGVRDASAQGHDGDQQRRRAPGRREGRPPTSRPCGCAVRWLHDSLRAGYRGQTVTFRDGFDHASLSVLPMPQGSAKSRRLAGGVMRLRRSVFQFRSASLPGVLRLVLGDQISDGRLSSLRDLDPQNDTVLFAEVRSETDYVKHHKKKIALIFSGMRGFADRLRAKRIDVRYVGLDDPDNAGSLIGEVRRALAERAYDKVVATAPGEYRLMAEFEDFAASSNVPFLIREDDRYLATPGEFAQWADGRRELRMEFFYREMRKRYGLLMDGDKPVGGAWNFDKENRKAMPKRLTPPHRRFIAPNATTRGAIADVERIFPDYFGTLDGFGFATTPGEAEGIVDHFIAAILPGFGDYQDAMVENEPWMWHAIISAAMNPRPDRPRSTYAGAPKPSIAPAARRSTRWKGSSARSSAGASTCAACTG